MVSTRPGDFQEVNVVSLHGIVYGFLGLILPTSRFVIVGHRGWRAKFPDNSLAGILAAAEFSDTIEVDVRRSGDGKLVLSHDPIMGGLLVSEQPWSVLAETDLGSGHRPALLDEAISSLPDTPFQFEIKNDPAGPGHEPDHRLALEAAERARPRDVIASFNWDTIDAVRRAFPDVSTGVLVEPPTSLAQARSQALRGGHQHLLVSHQMLLATEIMPDDELIHHAWTVNDPDTASMLVKRGVSGIITDDPQKMRDVLGRDNELEG